MADAGYSEIQLLGQNVNSYLDPSARRSFAELLAAVGEVPGIRRVRFMTSHPRDFTRDIVDAIDAVESVCNHVHLPVQSGSNATLKAMLRLYTVEEYLERIAWVKAARRKIALTSDIIVGFPGETESDFMQTMDLLAKVRYDGIFGFKYSPRPNTPALKYDDAVPEDEKTKRLMILQERQRQIQAEDNARHLGEVAEVMVEGKNEARAQWIGRTGQHKTLNFTAGNSTSGASELEVGSYYQVKVTATHPNSLVGELVDAEPVWRAAGRLNAPLKPKEGLNGAPGVTSELRVIQ